MRHHVTIGITDKGEVIALNTDSDVNSHRETMADLSAKAGVKSQRQRFVTAYTLSTDHYVAIRRFPIREDIALAPTSATQAPAPTEHPSTPSEPAATSPEIDLPRRLKK